MITQNIITTPMGASLSSYNQLLFTTEINESGTIEFVNGYGVRQTFGYIGILNDPEGVTDFIWSPYQKPDDGSFSFSFSVAYENNNNVVSLTATNTKDQLSISANGASIYMIAPARSAEYSQGAGFPNNSPSVLDPLHSPESYPSYLGEVREYDDCLYLIDFSPAEYDPSRSITAYRQVLSFPCFSVGTYTDDLKTGSPTISITDSIATFSIAQSNDGIGAGDEVIYGSLKAYLSSKVGANKAIWNVVDCSGSPVPNCTATTVTSIKRVFNYLADSLVHNNSPLSGIGAKIGSNNFQDLNISPTVFCYNDHKLFGTGYDNKQVICSGYITSNAIYLEEIEGIYGDVLTISSPYNTLTECNTRQRTIGVPDTGYCLSLNSTSAIAMFKDIAVVCRGIEISGNAPIGIEMSGLMVSAYGQPTSADVYNKSKVIQCMIYNKGSYGVYFKKSGFSGSYFDNMWNGSIWNSIIYNQTIANVIAEALTLDISQSVLYGGNYGVVKQYYYDFFLHYVTFAGHVQDLSGTGSTPQAGQSYGSRGNDAWFGSSGITNKQLTQTPAQLFKDYSNGNFLITPMSKLYRAEEKIELNILPRCPLAKLQDPDITGAILP